MPELTSIWPAVLGAAGCGDMPSANLYIPVMRTAALRSWATAATALALAACSATEGPLLFHTQASSADAGDQPDSAAVVRAGMSLQYQITGELDTSVDAQLFVVDLFDASERDVRALRAAGRVVVAYVSVGSFEPWRADAATFPKSGVGDSLAGYPDESWLDIRDPEVRAVIAARFDRARDKGFDGVFASTLGGYKQQSGFALTRTDELDYARFLSDAAKQRGLSAGLSGDFELGDDVADLFDWALAIDCIGRGYCNELAAFMAQGKPVFDMETTGERASVCMQAAAFGIPTTIKRPAYDVWREPCT